MMDKYTRDRLAECQTETERMNVLAFVRMEEKEKRVTDRELQLRHNNGFDTLLMLDNGEIVGVWTVTDKEYTDFITLDDLNDWELTNVDPTLLPADYGQLIAIRPNGEQCHFFDK